MSWISSPNPTFRLQPQERHSSISEDALHPLINILLKESLQSVELSGLMTISYRDMVGAETRRSFAPLLELLEIFRTRYGENFSELSMGMSGDYPLAIEERVTMVRVGSALFGPR